MLLIWQICLGLLTHDKETDLYRLRNMLHLLFG